MPFAISARRQLLDVRRFALLTLAAFAATTVGLLAAPTPASAWGSNEFGKLAEANRGASTACWGSSPKQTMFSKACSIA